MAEIRTDDWAEFTEKVASAHSKGRNVVILTGPETNGDFVAEVTGARRKSTPAGENSTEDAPKKTEA